MPNAISNTSPLLYHVWGTLRILLEAKANGLIDSFKPQLNRVSEAGLWISEEIAQRVLALAGEK